MSNLEECIIKAHEDGLADHIAVRVGKGEQILNDCFYSADYEINSKTLFDMASVTKIMTLLLVMEAVDGGSISLGDSVSVSENAAGMGGSQVFLSPGEQMSVETLVKCTVISSANDAAVALAEYVCWSEEAFVARMN